MIGHRDQILRRRTRRPRPAANARLRGRRRDRRRPPPGRRPAGTAEQTCGRDHAHGPGAERAPGVQHRGPPGRSRGRGPAARRRRALSRGPRRRGRRVPTSRSGPRPTATPARRAPRPSATPPGSPATPSATPSAPWPSWSARCSGRPRPPSRAGSTLARGGASTRGRPAQPGRPRRVPTTTASARPSCPPDAPASRGRPLRPDFSLRHLSVTLSQASTSMAGFRMPENMTPTTRPGPAPDPRSPFVFDTRELGRRPGSMRGYRRHVPAPAGLGLDMIGVPEGAPLALDLRCSRSPKVCSSRAPVTAPAGRRVRAVPRPGRRGLAVELVRAVRLPGQHHGRDDRAGRGPPDRGGSHRPRTGGARRVVLGLPWTPLCRPDCAGLCPNCGQRLDDLPAGTHARSDRPALGRAVEFAERRPAIRPAHRPVRQT